MPQDYEKFIGPDGVVRIGHSLTRREPEPKMPEQPQPQPQQRPTAPKVKPQQMEKAAKAAQQPVEAKAGQGFAQRLRAILELPVARSKQRQALAIVAETAASPKEAAAVLGALPEDKAVGFAHGGSLFPGSTVKHDAEAQRILSILRHPEAEGRERQALELATNTTLSLDQAVALLASMPKVEHSRIPTIAERCSDGEWFGEMAEEPVRASRKADPWAKVIEKTNAGLAATQPAPTAPIKETFK